MEKRPPPYFPQTALNPTNANRYKKFKLAVFAAIVLLVLLLTGVGYGIYYLVRWLF